MTRWTFEPWRGTFYPEGLKEKDWFKFYETRFPIVELNVTFYRLPKPAVFASWHKNALGAFRFFVKGSRFSPLVWRQSAP